MMKISFNSLQQKSVKISANHMTKCYNFRKIIPFVTILIHNIHQQVFFCFKSFVVALYHIAGKFGGWKLSEFGEQSMICQTKTIRFSTYNYNLLADLLIHQTFFCQMLKKSQFIKLFHYTVMVRFQLLHDSNKILEFFFTFLSLERKVIKTAKPYRLIHD